MSSSSTSDGQLTITRHLQARAPTSTTPRCWCRTASSSAEPRLPEEVRRLGVVTRKASPDLLMVIHLFSPDGSRDSDYISNYATLQIRDRLARLDGVGDVRIFGARDYAMRIWIDPDKAAAHDLTADEIVAALRAQNVQVPAGAVGQPPFSAARLGLRAQHQHPGPADRPRAVRRHHPEERRRAATWCASRDVARVELGAQDYRINAYLDRRPKAVAHRHQPAARAPTRSPPPTRC